jgi:hypothetical protein
MRVTSKLANEKARDIDSDGIVLSEEKKQQIIALGKLGWPLLRIEQATGVRRGTGAFAAALSDATENPPPMTPETRQIAARIKAAEKSVMADQDRVSKLTQQVVKARGGAKDTTQEQLDLAQAQLSLDQDELDDVYQNLIRAGGDRRAIVQKQLDQHEASEGHAETAHPAASANTSATPPTPSVELVKSGSVWP